MREPILLSANDSSPMYSQIVAQILAKIMANDWPPGHALPSIRELASISMVSVITVKRAYLELEHAGVIVTRQGKGSYVADNIDVAKNLALADFNMHLKNMIETARKTGMTDIEIVKRVRAAINPTQ